jgi:hypothetical protein
VRLLRYRLYEPGLNCANCHTLYVTNDKKPACLSGKCPIVEIAGNKRLNRLVDGFIQVEVLALANGYSSFQERALKDSGLSEESPETILEMRAILAEYREWSAKKSTKGKR